MNQQHHNRIDFGTKVTSWLNQPIGPPITNKRVDLSYHRIAKIPRKDRGGSRRYTFRVKLWVLANSDNATLNATLSAGYRGESINPIFFN